MNEVITKERVLEIGFKELDSSTDHGCVNCEYDGFRVIIFSNNEENPAISYRGCSPWMTFPGVHAMKDLKDLLFMHYGENEYTERFGHLPARIVEETKTGHPKEELMTAFDEGFLSNDPDLSHYPNFTSDQWYSKKYGK